MTDYNRREPCDLPLTEMGCKLADQVADRAVKKTFAILGVDIARPESVEAFREDLRFSKHMRKYATTAMTAAIMALVAGLCTALWLGLKGSQ